MTPRTAASRVARVVSTLGGVEIWSDDTVPYLPNQMVDIPLRLSPDGTLVATPDAGQVGGVSTVIVKNGVVTASVPGWPAGWIDDARLLANTYQPARIGWTFRSAAVFSSTGQLIPSPTLPFLINPEPVAPESLYGPDQNRIYSLTTGSEIWSSAAAHQGRGALAGGYVVFASDTVLRRVAH
jgi:hypothetical protein